MNRTDRLYAIVEELRAREYDVVLLDLRIPEVDGYEVIAYLEKHLPHVLERVVLVTLAPEEAEGLPVAGVLPKSVDPTQILSFISNRVLGKSNDAN